MDIEARITKDIEVFAKEAAKLDIKGSLARTLAVLRLEALDSKATLDTDPGAGRSQRPAPARESD